MTLLVFETTLPVALFADFAATGIFVFAAAFGVTDLAATLPALAGKRAEAVGTAFAVGKAAFTGFLVALAIGPSTKWVANAAIKLEGYGLS